MLFLGGGDLSDMYLQWKKNNVVQSLNYHNAGYGNNLRYGVLNPMTMINLETVYSQNQLSTLINVHVKNLIVRQWLRE